MNISIFLVFFLIDIFLTKIPKSFINELDFYANNNSKQIITSFYEAKSNNQKYKIKWSDSRIVAKSPGKKIKFIIVGDIKTASEVKQEIDKYHHGDYTFLFTRIKKDLQSADFRIANLEGGITESTLPLKPISLCQDNSIKSYCCGYKCHFRSQPEILNGVVEYAGFNLLNIENNHINDFVNEKFDTIKTLKKYNIPFISYENPFSINVKKCNFKFFSYNFIQNFNLTFEEITLKMIKDLKSTSHNTFKIIYGHDGHEYFHKFFDRQEIFAHNAIDNGADLVVYSHAHVTEKFSIYKGKHIAYGLGNFVFNHEKKDTEKFYFLKFEVEENCKNVVNFKWSHGIIDNQFRPYLID